MEDLECAIEVRGDLTLRLDGTSPSVLPLLRRVGGSLNITANGNLSGQPTQFELPALERVGALRLRGMGEVERLRMPVLTKVKEQLLVGGNAALTELDTDTWPSLQEIGQDLLLGPCKAAGDVEGDVFSCEENPLLARVELPALVVVALNVVLGGNPSLTTFDAPLLEHVDTLQVRQRVLVTDNDLDYVDEPFLADLGQLAAFNVPALQAARSIELSPLAQLAKLELPALSSVESITATGDGAVAPSFVISFPSLEKTSELTESETYVDWDVPVLAEVERIDLSQQRAEVPAFPALATIGQFTAGSTDFDCGQVFPLVPGDSYPKLSLGVTDFRCPEVTSLPSLSLNGGDAATVDLSSLESAGSLSFFGGFTNVELPELMTADRIEFFSCANLTGISMPQLGSLGSLVIHYTSLPARPDMPLLTNLGDLLAYYNWAWSQCDLDDWASSLSIPCSCVENLSCP